MLAFIASGALKHPEMVGLNPEYLHELMWGGAPRAALARALMAGKLWHLDINDGYRLKHDVDIAIGLVNPLDWLSVLMLLRANGFNGPFNLDFKPLRTTSNHGVFAVSFPNAVDRFITLWEIAGEALEDPVIREATAARDASRSHLFLMTYWLGIDVGTGGTRALLVNAHGKAVHSFTSPHEDIRMERPLWAEQRPENWWEAGKLAIRGVLAEARTTGANVRGIGLSGQMHGLVMLDAADRVIRRALIWCDQRSQPQVDGINASVGRQAVLAWTANPVLTGFTLPKLLWVRDNEPAHFDALRKVLLPKDYIRFCLTGDHATDVSDASGTSFFDVVQRRWSNEMLDAFASRGSLLAG